ncbi:MAG: outer membrane protein transport protein [Limnobacter sp.]|nr:outer membrane protein transport protein [Limnobacter sp.]
MLNRSMRGFAGSRRALAVALTCCFSSSAMAAGTSLDATSISGMANAYAGQAAEGGDASVIFANPAALTRFKRAELTQGLTVTTLDTTYTSNQDNDGAPTNDGNQGSNGQVFDREDGYDSGAFIPNTYLAIPLSEKMVMGFSATGSHGLVLHYDDDFPGRNQGSDIDFKVIRLNLGVGYQMWPTLSLGINGSYERYYQKVLVRLNYREAVNGQAGNDNAADALDVVTTVPEETNAQLRMFGWAFNTQVGALWEPTENTRIGVSYRPKTEFKSNNGKFTIDDTQDAQNFRAFLRDPVNNVVLGAAGVDGEQSADDLDPDQRIQQDITLNDEFRLSIFHHATPKLDLMATYTRQDFTVTHLKYTRQRNDRTLQEIPQNFKVGHSYRFGFNYKLYRRLTLKGGLAVENSVIDDATRITVLPDSDRVYYNVGGALDVSRDATVHFAYQYLDTDPAPVGQNDQITPPEVRGGDFDGTVQLDTHFFGIGLTQRF